MSLRIFVKLAVAIMLLVSTGALPVKAFPLQTQTKAPKSDAATSSVLLILNKAENTLSIVDPMTLKTLGKVPTGEGPHEVVASADGRLAYVANYGTQQKVGNSISIIDIAARREIKRLELGPLFRPHGIVVANGKVYFTAEVNRVVARYDPATDRVDWIMGTGQSITHMLVITPDGRRAYTANIISDTVTAIDFTLPVPQQVSQIQVGKQPEGIAVSPDGREVWVGQNGDGQISIIDTATNKVKESIKVGEVPIRLKFTPDGKRVLVSDPKAGELILLDAATRKEIKRLKVEGAPVGIVIPPDGSRAFVAVVEANKVMVIDLAKLEITGAIEAGQGPDGLAWATGSQSDTTTQPKPATGAQQ